MTVAVVINWINNILQLYNLKGISNNI